MRILVVEDEGLVAFAIEWALKLAGHQVLGPVDSVEEAITLCTNSQPELALIDLNLRDGGDGVHVARYLTARWGTPTLFLSAQTAHARANRQIAWGLVRKPYDIASLPRIVEFVSAVAKGQRPTQIPAGLELFRPLDS